MRNRKKRGRLFRQVGVRSMGDALYERLIDECWEEIQEVFERPEVREAEAVIMRAIAEAFTPDAGKKPRGRARR